MMQMQRNMEECLLYILLIYIYIYIYIHVINGYLSPQHDASSGSGWKVAANKLNKQSWTADKGWVSSLGVGRVANNAFP
jgi:hypothetical protein